MIKVKVSKATGPVLDWMVATAEQASIDIGVRKQVLFDTYEDDPPAGVNEHDDTRWQVYNPSENWAQGGPILDQMRGIKLKSGRKPNSPCYAHIVGYNGVERWHQTGKTVLIAAMRCYVASKLGDEVEVPKELLT